MLHEEYIENGYSEEYIKSILVKLTKLGCKNAVLTGVSFEDGKLGVMVYNKEKDTFSSYFTEKVNESFHGTGDVFSSACVGALMQGLSLEGAIKTAANYTVEAIKATMREENHNWYGVNFEEAIPYLLQELKNNK